ncbi:RuBisCO large subunit C-terminal-like domain-containing protein, partial [Thiohalocapsa sp.]|uniref:RuBisCO large subunit C-terminal-like domain-containing protein n=1 Tax=Thiohalocapsa sp. TaxID=2497641 RepID=UPI0025EA69CC
CAGVDWWCPLPDVAGATGARGGWFNGLPVGRRGGRRRRRHATVPLIAHFPFIAAMSRLPAHGVHTRVMTKLQRLAGFDVIIMPGFGPRMMTAEDEVLECIAACTDPMGPIKPALPVPGGSDSAATLQGVHDKIASPDFGFVPGRGVFSHPHGPAGGAASLRQAWEAIAGGVSVEKHAEQHPELAAALEAFG